MKAIILLICAALFSNSASAQSGFSNSPSDQYWKSRVLNEMKQREQLREAAMNPPKPIVKQRFAQLQSQAREGLKHIANLVAFEKKCDRPLGEIQWGVGRAPRKIQDMVWVLRNSAGYVLGEETAAREVTILSDNTAWTGSCGNYQYFNIPQIALFTYYKADDLVNSIRSFQKYKYYKIQDGELFSSEGGAYKKID